MTMSHESRLLVLEGLRGQPRSPYRPRPDGWGPDQHVGGCGEAPSGQQSGSPPGSPRPLFVYHVTDPFRLALAIGRGELDWSTQRVAAALLLELVPDDLQVGLTVDDVICWAWEFASDRDRFVRGLVR